MDKSKVIFGNKMSRATYKKAVRGKKGYVKKFGDDSNVDYELMKRQQAHRRYSRREGHSGCKA